MENKNLIYLFGGLAVLGIAGYYLYNKYIKSAQTSTTSSVSTTNAPTSNLGTQSNPYQFSNGWVSTGYYELTSSQFTILSTIYSNLTNPAPVANQNTYIQMTNYLNDATSPGSLENPYIFDIGWQGTGYYQLTTKEYNLLSTDTQYVHNLTNPTYITNQAGYNALSSDLYILEYNSNPINTSTSVSTSTVVTSPTNINTSSTVTTSPIQTPSYPTNTFTLSANTSDFVVKDGNSITFSLTGGVPNSSGLISGNNIGIIGFTLDSHGNWTGTATYEFNQNEVSALANAVQDSINLTLPVVAFDYASESYSNTVEIKLTYP